MLQQLSSCTISDWLLSVDLHPIAQAKDGAFGRYVQVTFRSPGQPLSTGTVSYSGAFYRFGVGDVRWLPYNSFWVERSNLMSANQCLLQLKIAAIL